jgi:hypothetical protein
MIRKGRNLIFFLLTILFFVWYSLAIDQQIFDYAIIPDTDTINFQWDIWGVQAYVKIDYNNIYLVTGADGIVYHCWQVIWTGVTNKMGRVFFWYTWSDGVYHPVYICNDWKRRGYAKLEVWGWIQFDSLEFSWPIVNQFKWDYNKFWHSADWFWNWTWYGFSDWIWMWIWNYVSITNNNPRKLIFNRISPTKSYAIIEPGHIANWYDAALLNMKVVDIDGNVINGLWFKKIQFLTWWSKFVINWQSSLFFTWSSYYLSWYFYLATWVLNKKVYSITPYSGNFVLGCFRSGAWFNITGTTSFLPPFKINFSIVDGDWDWKLLIWDIETWKLLFYDTDPNVTNLVFNWYGKYIGTGLYSFVAGSNINTYSFNLKLYPLSDYVDNSLKVYIIYI